MISIISSGVHSFLAGDLDSSSVHFWLLSSSFIAEIAVGIGILLESKFETRKERAAAALVMGGIVAGFAATFMLFVFDEAISRRQQSKIAELDTQLVARTKELLEVRKLTADRSLTLEDKKSLAASLSTFRDQPAKIVIFPVNFESVFIAHELYGAMLNAHWAVSPPEMLLRPQNDILTQGLLIERSDDDASTKAANRLFETLKSIGVSVVGPSSGRVSIPEMNLFDHSKPLVWVLVGDKPTPLLDWIKP